MNTWLTIYVLSASECYMRLLKDGLLWVTEFVEHKEFTIELVITLISSEVSAAQLSLMLLPPMVQRLIIFFLYTPACRVWVCSNKLSASESCLTSLFTRREKALSDWRNNTALIIPVQASAGWGHNAADHPAILRRLWCLLPHSLQSQSSLFHHPCHDQRRRLCKWIHICWYA